MRGSRPRVRVLDGEVSSGSGRDAPTPEFIAEELPLRFCHPVAAKSAYMRISRKAPVGHSWAPIALT